MTDEEKQKAVEAAKAAEDAAKGSPPAEAQKTEIVIPKARFDEVNERAKKLQADLDARVVADKKAEEERLTEQQKYKELADKRAAELEALQKQAEADKADANAKAKKATHEASVIAAAAELGFADPKDAVLYVAEDTEDVPAALKKLAEEKNYLLKKNAAPPRLPANKGAEGATETRDEKRKRLFG